MKKKQKIHAIDWIEVKYDTLEETSDECIG